MRSVLPRPNAADRPDGGSQQRSGPPACRIHVIAFSTPETAGPLSCWRQWMQKMQAADPGHEYVLHVPPHQDDRRAERRTHFKGRAWKAAVRAKVPFVLATLQALARQCTQWEVPSGEGKHFPSGRDNHLDHVPVSGFCKRLGCEMPRDRM